jgi:DHA3 family tetracycline resistance protein-like MFS transporter
MTSIYLRATQLGVVGTLAGSVLSGAIAGIALSLPMLLGGSLMCMLGVILFFVMPENRPLPERDLKTRASVRRQVWRVFLGQTQATRTAILAAPGLALLLSMTLLLGMWTESFDRLGVHSY